MDKDSLLAGFIDVYFGSIKNVETLISRPVAEYRLSFEQYQIMHDLAHNQVTSLTEIVQRRGVTKPAIARQLSVLRELGYVTQKVAPDDHRRHILALTPSGRRTEKEAEAASIAEFDRWVAVLGEEKLEALLRMLEEASAKLFVS
ncbi:MarR family winged helix-turn-helix transcriptional regulator [Lacticaseibacillus parakribbianus]|uniref:MarR family winged helix-turn-helix transcriptional regulator n=1 Tax=Lacticaseibacillus parakribbianus TaxID=2970927 RepID=UPI0021CAFD5D|nr:MarR family winged helix-turn-helix transcriptional regulator [Lacticaseibacillus parakribbianus]